MWNIFVVIALTAGGLSLSIASTVEAIPLSSQDAQQEFLNRRVTDLEETLEQLRNEYGARLATIEAEIAQLRDVQLGTTPDVAVTAEEGAAEVVGETMSEEERVELERKLAELLGEGRPETTGAGGQGSNQGAGRRFQSQTRNLNQLNPEISVTGDMSAVFADRTGDEEINQFRFNEFEASFQAPLDPYSSAKFFVVQEEGEFKVEEAYIDYNTLPAGLGIKAGQLRLDWGKLNRYHHHSLPQADRPAVHLAIWGEEGLTGLGTSLSWIPPSFLGGYNEVIVQVVNDANEVSFSGQGFDQPVFLVHETNYFDLSDASYIEVGLSAATGISGLDRWRPGDATREQADFDGELRTQVFGTDWNFNWAPPETSLYRGFELRGEFLWQRRATNQGIINSWGTYTYGVYKLNRRAFVGLRGDYTQLPMEPGKSLWGASPYFEWWQSEWARFRVQYSYGSRQLEIPEPEHKFYVQLTWALGPHKHEKY